MTCSHGRCHALVQTPSSLAEASICLEPIEPGKLIPFNHHPHSYVKDDVLKTAVRLHAKVVMDSLIGKI